MCDNVLFAYHLFKFAFFLKRVREKFVSKGSLLDDVGGFWGVETFVFDLDGVIWIGGSLVT